MLRSLIVMAVKREVSGITDWGRKTRSDSVIAAICGFDPDSTPGVGTCYDFQNRAEEELKAVPDERFPGSSEATESVFGKFVMPSSFLSFHKFFS